MMDLKSSYYQRQNQIKNDLLEIEELKAQVYIPDVSKAWDDFLQDKLKSRYTPELKNMLPDVSEISSIVIEILKENEADKNLRWDFSRGQRPNLEPRILGIGQSGIVIQKYNYHPGVSWDYLRPLICKLGKNLNNEYEILLNMKESSTRKIEDVIVHDLIHVPLLRQDRCIVSKDNFVAIATETNQGYTMEFWANIRIEWKDHNLLWVGKDMISALMEMRKYGISYHRDIRPSNILIIDRPSDDAAHCDTLGGARLLDVEHATKDIDEPVRADGNRRFRGINDLTSLGENLFYAITRTSLFAQTEKHKIDLSDVANEIARNRSLAYHNGVLDNKDMNRIERMIPYENIVPILQALMNAKKDDHEKIYQLFAKAQK